MCDQDGYLPAAKPGEYHIFVPSRRINEIVLGKCSITADTALHLSRYFGNTDKFWMGLQGDYGLEDVRAKVAGALEKISSRAT